MAFKIKDLVITVLAAAKSGSPRAQCDFSCGFSCDDFGSGYDPEGISCGDCSDFVSVECGDCSNLTCKCTECTDCSLFPSCIGCTDPYSVLVLLLY